MITALTSYLRKRTDAMREKPAPEAYDAWSSSYDNQPGNLMLDLDEQLFAELIQHVDLENKRVVDIGCGTGRHWLKMYALRPNLMIGLDVSQGMLDRLKQKFPDAIIQLITDDSLKMLPDACIDCLTTTLTVAHIRNIETAFHAWTRVLKNGGDLIMTDFHPDLLANGGKRSFRHQGKSMAVLNYVHPLEKVIRLLQQKGMKLMLKKEKFVDPAVRHYYASQHALPVYERFKGLPVIYGLHLKKTHVAE